VEETRTSQEHRRKQYRTIYELLFQSPRIYTKTVSSVLGTDPSVASRRMKEAFDLGYISGPQIRRRSYKNTKEYMYFATCETPLKSFLSSIKDAHISYHAVMSGFANLWITSTERLDCDSDVIGGPRTDYHISFAPNHSWNTAILIMQEKVESFSPHTYSAARILSAHWDEHLKWDLKDEILFREFKYSVRKKLSPIMRKYHISGEKLYEWLGRLSECCTITTSFFPKGFSMYDSYLFAFETDYEDFIIDLFSELPTSALFFKVSNTLFLYAQITGRFVRFIDIQNPGVGQLQIPLLVDDLLERGILKSEAHSIIEYYWGKSL
jgi:hypothetical protein